MASPEAAIRSARFLVAVCLALGFTACSSGGEASLPGTATAPAGNDWVKVPVGMVEEMRRQSTPFQVELVEDGRLTFSEYEKAFFADVQCVTEAGILVPKTPAVSADQQFVLETFYPDRESLERGLPEEARCRNTYLEWIERAWRSDMGRYQQVYDEARRALGRCARSAGLDLPEFPTADDTKPFFEDFNPEYFRCLKKTQESQNLDGWMP